MSNPSNPSDNESWSLHNLSINNEHYIVRINDSLKSRIADPEYKFKLGVAVPLKSSGNFPSSEENQELLKLESNLINTLQNQALFAAVITGGGMKEWMFYISDEESTKKIIMELKAKSILDLQMDLQPDEKWAIYQQFYNQN